MGWQHILDLIMLSQLKKTMFVTVILSLYCNPILNDKLYNCLLSSMSDIQEDDRKATVIFVGVLNAHHQEWLSSLSGTDRQGLAVYKFSNLSGCVWMDQQIG